MGIFNRAYRSKLRQALVAMIAAQIGLKLNSKRSVLEAYFLFLDLFERYYDDVVMVSVMAVFVPAIT
ncbi:hypothetical protein [Acinetobacter johnsonii]|uniref:Uncharacterized protein n=1 Tax=Acinetobacter johnsonii TaxID=40214 RepID=A0A3R9EXL5_ACIJO|nr:hypothetical protein [Acinetobacter johnsonii]MDH0713106.1 hypothetical protein [Acinetobacter johnsonii]RSE21347.1 hypothetical protein EGT73_13845 [Acinetobacter johnsonii]